MIQDASLSRARGPSGFGLTGCQRRTLSLSQATFAAIASEELQMNNGATGLQVVQTLTPKPEP